MPLAEALETAMLICFSTSWYWSMRKVWRERDGRQVHRIIPAMVAVGCLLGLAAELVEFEATGALGFPAFLYGWNIVLSAAQSWLLGKLSDPLDGRRVAGVDPLDPGRRHRPEKRPAAAA